MSDKVTQVKNKVKEDYYQKILARKIYLGDDWLKLGIPFFVRNNIPASIVIRSYENMILEISSTTVFVDEKVKAENFKKQLKMLWKK